MDTPTPRKIRFNAKVLQPEKPMKGMVAFLLLPAQASGKLPTRSALTVEGAINGHAFRSVLQPDGQKSHWLKLTATMLKSAAAQVGDVVTLEIAQSKKELETAVPADLRKALSGSAKAAELWARITPVARRDWILWVTSAKQAETRARRIHNACDMLAGGKKRVCCFDRSGYYSKTLSAPKAR